MYIENLLTKIEDSDRSIHHNWSAYKKLITSYKFDENDVYNGSFSSFFIKNNVLNYYIRCR